MARLLKGVAPEFEEIKQLSKKVAHKNTKDRNYGRSLGIYTYFEGKHELEEQAFKAIEKRTTIVKQQVADSHAFYEVVKRQPLQIRWIPFCDKWTADPAWIRGLRLSDVEQSERWENAFRKLGA